MKKIRFSRVIFLAIVIALFVPMGSFAIQPMDVVINEVAWMGTTASYSDEWMELYNGSTSDIDLSGWTLSAVDGTPSITLSGIIPSKDYFLLEKTDDNSVPGITADIIYSGSLGNSGEELYLKDNNNNVIDSVSNWYCGDNSTKATMERTDATLVDSSTNWNNSTTSYVGGFGTPKALNSLSNSYVDPLKEQINNVSNAPGAINVYFNKTADTTYASFGNKANYNVNLENRLVSRINNATSTIDIATYEINLPGVVDALVNKASEGVSVRMLADAKDASDPSYIERYQLMRLNLEKLARGKDLIHGTSDDVLIFSDSPIFAVEDATLRSDFGLPSSLSDFNQVNVTVGSTSTSGYLIADAEEKSVGKYYSPGEQMHNKFLVIDGTWVWTGSWNFTVTGLYGSDENRANNILGGNTQNSVEINSSSLADIYKTEFEEMWGSSTMTPDKVTSNFHGRKTDNTVHSLYIGGKLVEVYFSPGDNAIGKLKDLIVNEANDSAYFSIFAWSDQSILDELKNKYEGSYVDNQGSLTGFKVKGVFDASYWNQWWSASVDMTGRVASKTSTLNPNTRWNNPAPVYKDVEVRKLHSKTMIIDGESTSDPTVVIGSTNWSNNGNDVNDENLLIIHDTVTANQFVQEFYARYIPASLN
ncbi:phospholipase D-like domain-containing protein [Helicovermis profundi]|uniref:phospholipase D n=1 Tax=Helicovermis profundi TaxID=3065157 RepID=A0AAU9E2V4_9FIRM|nr:hypothetical protein HLPR_12000 [Clostridia bacterium S502]